MSKTFYFIIPTDSSQHSDTCTIGKLNSHCISDNTLWMNTLWISHNHDLIAQVVDRLEKEQEKEIQMNKNNSSHYSCCECGTCSNINLKIQKFEDLSELKPLFPLKENVYLDHFYWDGLPQNIPKNSPNPTSWWQRGFYNLLRWLTQLKIEQNNNRYVNTLEDLESNEKVAVPHFEQFVKN